MTTQFTREMALSLAGYYEKDAQRLIDQYSTGVRPSWVSGDIGIAQHKAARYRKLADDMKVETDE